MFYLVAFKKIGVFVIFLGLSSLGSLEIPIGALCAMTTKGRGVRGQSLLIFEIGIFLTWFLF